MSFFDSLPIPAFIIGTDHRLSHWNKALAELIGLHPEEVLGTNRHSELFSANGRRSPADAVLETAAGEPIAHEYARGAHPPLTETRGDTVFFPGIHGGIWLHMTAEALRNGETVVGAIQYLEDVTEIRQMKRALLDSEKKLGKKNDQLQKLLNYMRDPNIFGQDFSSFIVEECVRISESQIGFFGQVNDDETVMTTQIWSDQTIDACSIADVPVKFSVETGGIWAESIRSHKVFVDNDFARSDRRKKGFPVGHIPVQRYLSIPVNSAGKAIAVLGLANKSSDYTNDDIIYLSLFMENMLTILQKKKAELSLLEMNKKLSNLVKILEEKTQETQTLNEMANQLQNCQSIEAVFTLSAVYLEKLCPGSGGTFYMINQSKTVAEAVKSWGDPAPCAERFPATDCPAIRSGQPYLADTRHPDLICKCFPAPRSGASFCVPIAARGKTMGILHVDVGRLSPDPESEINQKQPLCISAVEHISAALVNLNLLETLWQQAIRDNLTGLFNRRYLDESLPLVLNQAERTGTAVGVIMFDIDHFKDFNDTCGHDRGDVLLRELGLFLNGHIRGGDIIARYGGDEFLAVLPGATLHDSVLRAEELRRKVKDVPAFRTEKLPGGCTLSFGVAAYPEHGRSAGVLLKKADTALYKAKHDGRDRVAAASPDD